MKPALVAALLFAVACATTPPDKPTVGDPHPKPVSVEAFPLEIQPGPMPTAVEEAPDDTARVFACVDYNHITLLNETDKEDTLAVEARLGELKTASKLCPELVRKTFKDFQPFVLAYDREWNFYEAYFRLTLASLRGHNQPAFCRRYKTAITASRQTLDAVERYAGWLNRQLAAQQTSEPYLKTMQARATEKVLAFRVVVRRLEPQYKKECIRP